jgi:hypothetical protein
MGFGPLAWPNQPGWSNPTGQVLGRSNRPRPASAPHLSPLTLSLSSDLKSLPLSSGDSGRLRRVPPPPPRVKCSPTRPLPAPPNGIANRFPSEVIGLLSPLGICRLRSLRCGASPLELAEHAEDAQVLALLVCARRWKR